MGANDAPVSDEGLATRAIVYMMNSENEVKQVRCPKCKRMLGELQSGQVVIRCTKCKLDCRATVVLIPKIIVEIVAEQCNTAPASA